MGDKNIRGSKTRRSILGACSQLALIGCVTIETNPRSKESGGSTPTHTPTDTYYNTPDELEMECTYAYINGFEWNSGFEEDTFSGTLINKGDVAGVVPIIIEFYKSESKSVKTGEITRDIAIGAQETKDIQIKGHSPTEDSEWAVMSVGDQDCTFKNS